MLGDGVATDMEGTLRQVAAIGYQEVELPNFYGRSHAALREAIDAAGLTCPSIHAMFQPLIPNLPTIEDPARIADAANALGAHHVIAPLFPIPHRLARAAREGETPFELIGAISRGLTLADWQRTAAMLNETGAVLARGGLRMGYHNHNAEFAQLPDGRTGLDVLIVETDPELVDFEFDVGWAATAGVDPVALIERYADRIRQLHLKDIAPTQTNTEFRMNPADVGDGIIDWQALMHAAELARVEHFYVEQEPPFSEPPIEAARKGHGFLTKSLRPHLANARQQ
jgi:sugar phosphate isomerase/epimerase